MNLNSIVTRFFNQPVKKRIYQGVNGMIVQLAGRPVKISHLLEYPKCGGTWVRNMVQTYLGGEPYFVDRFVTPRTVIHLHRMYNSRYSFPIVLFRDPRDVFVSYYFHEKQDVKQNTRLAIKNFMEFSDSLDVKEDFANYLEVKLTKITDPYFTYREFFESWYPRDDICVVFYENFKKSPENELRKILLFLDEKIDDQKVREAIEYNSFENVTLRKYGKSRKPGEEESSQFQRKGISGDWVNHFNNRAREIMDFHLGDVIIELGYEKRNNG
jgi:hypothetical protein